MPHIVLEGPIGIDECQESFEPFLHREEDLVVKGERIFCDRDRQAALIETLVVDRGHTQRFFILLAPKNGGITVRLEPLTDPEKTRGVRRALAVVAHRIRGATGCSYGKTNISDYLIR